jgi:hypothetical protein
VVDFEQEELNIPNEEGVRLISGALDSQVLWNKVDIMLETPTPTSQPSQPSSSQLGDDDDNNGSDDKGGHDGDNASGPSNTPQRSPSPGNNNP